MTAEGYLLLKKTELSKLLALKAFSGQPIDLFSAVLQPPVLEDLTSDLGLAPGPAAADQGTQNAKRKRTSDD